jgi:hypothetical protein
MKPTLSLPATEALALVAAIARPATAATINFFMTLTPGSKAESSGNPF